MENFVVPVPLQVKLGEHATEGLVDMFSGYQQFATDRYEHRLLDVEGRLRQEFRDGLAGVRVDLAETKADIIKWTLLMWVGQFAALAGVLSFLLRAR